MQKAHAFDVNCEDKRLRNLPNLSPLVGKPLMELDLKLNQLKVRVGRGVRARCV